MKITLLAAGSLGDVVPYIALAERLQRRGHQVRLATSPYFADRLSGTGAEFFSLEGGDPERIWADVTKRRPAGGTIGTAWRLMRGTTGMLEGFRRYSAACEGSEMVVVTSSTVPAAEVAVRMGVPVIGCHVSPNSGNSSYPAPLGPYWLQRRRLGALWNRATHAAASQLFWSASRSEINRWRVEDFGLRPLPWLGGYRRCSWRNIPFLFGFSPSLLPLIRGWPARYHVTGFWHDDEPSSWQPPNELVDFLNQGGPLAFAGFGSQPLDRRQWEVVVAGIRRAGCRLVLGRGWSDEPSTNLADERVYVIDRIPYRWIFSRVDVIVQHCGAGTVGEVVRSGTPSVAVPFNGEQRFWAERLYDAGVSPVPLNPRSIDADDVTTAVRSVLSDEHRRRRAASLGEKVAGETGLDNAVEIIARLASNGSSESTRILTVRS